MEKRKYVKHTHKIERDTRHFRILLGDCEAACLLRAIETHCLKIAVEHHLGKRRADSMVRPFDEFQRGDPRLAGHSYYDPANDPLVSEEYNALRNRQTEIEKEIRCLEEVEVHLKDLVGGKSRGRRRTANWAYYGEGDRLFCPHYHEHVLLPELKKTELLMKVLKENEQTAIASS
jgi:hypothetical protein